jgi:hypothetical protein
MAEEAYRIDPLRSMNVIGYANSLYTTGQVNQALALMRHAIDRWPADATIFVITIWTAAVRGETDFVRAILRSDWQHRYPERVQFFVDRVVGVAEGILHAPDKLLEESLRHVEERSGKGEAPIGYVVLCAFLGADLDQLYDLVDRMQIERLREPDALLPPLDGLFELVPLCQQPPARKPAFCRAVPALGIGRLLARQRPLAGMCGRSRRHLRLQATLPELSERGMGSDSEILLTGNGRCSPATASKP